MKKQNIFIVTIVLLMLIMSIGYSIFKVSASIYGKASAAENLNVEFIKIGKINEYGSTSATATISDDKKTIIVNVPNLMYRGSYAIIPITVKNVGKLPAKLESINEYGTDGNGTFEISYDGIAVTDKSLQPEEEVSFTIKVLWKNELINNSEVKDFYVKFNYVQG